MHRFPMDARIGAFSAAAKVCIRMKQRQQRQSLLAHAIRAREAYMRQYKRDVTKAFRSRFETKTR